MLVILEYVVYVYSWLVTLCFIIVTATSTTVSSTIASITISPMTSPSRGTLIITWSPTTSSSPTSSDNINIYIISVSITAIIVVTLMLIAIIATLLFCRKEKFSIRSSPIISIEVPLHPIASQHNDRLSASSNCTGNPYEIPQWNIDQQQRPSSESSSSELSFLEMLEPDSEQSSRYMKFDIYVSSDFTPTKTSMVCNEKQTEDLLCTPQPDLIYQEPIEPPDIDCSPHACSSEDDGACPYSSIYADALPLLRSHGPPIVSRKNIKPLRMLGTGHFGKVALADTVGLSNQYLGIGNSSDTNISMKVAVKTLKDSPSEEVRKSFEKEIKFMSRLRDDNVIRLLGICTTGRPFIMMEYMENGDLNHYLRQMTFTTETETAKVPNEIALHALVYMSIQIASGMKYLSSCKFIHRDLAARNILVGCDYIVKVADFGMSQNLYSAHYCRVSKLNVLPVRWMACECYYGRFSIQTDVWAFGITVWEIFTLCEFQPFSEFTDQEMIDDAVKGPNRKIPDQPEICPSNVYNIIKSCLQHEPSERATFSALHDQLKECYSNIL